MGTISKYIDCEQTSLIIFTSIGFVWFFLRFLAFFKRLTIPAWSRNFVDTIVGKKQLEDFGLLISLYS